MVYNALRVNATRTARRPGETKMTSTKRTDWCVIGTYENEAGQWVSEILAEGFATEDDAHRAKSQMRRNCSEIGYDVQSGIWAEQWCS
jgi:hypothetical protein